MFDLHAGSKVVLLSTVVAALGAGLEAQSSGYVYTIAGSEACVPTPTCIRQVYDSWAGSPLPVWLLATHNFNPGGGGGLHYTSTPFYDPYMSDGDTFPYLAGDDTFEAGHAFNLFAFVGAASGCPLLHTASAGNTGSNYTRLDHPALNGSPGARLLVTPLRQDSRIHEHLGVWFDSASQRWNVFYQNPATTMEIGTKFLILSDACFVGLSFWPVHVATAGNTVGPITALDHPAINGRPSAVLFVTQVWDEEAPVYNDRPAAVTYDLGTQRWQIYNDGGTAMPLGARFFWATAALVHRSDFELGITFVGWDGWVGATP